MAAELDNLTVDEIDGEFYWRCCRADLAAPIADLRGNDCVARLTSFGADFRSTFAFLAAANEFAQMTAGLEEHLLRGYPRIVLDHLVAGMRVAMRVPEVAVHVDRHRRWNYLMNVYAGSWTGTDVERAFFEAAERLSMVVERAIATGEAGFGVRNAEQQADVIHGSTPITFRLVSNPESATVADRGPVRVPFIEVVVSHPLPDTGDLALAYDRKARGRDKLHLKLPGATRRQEKEVALRTWSLGLLVAGGLSFNKALLAVTAVLDTLEISQPGFSQDRQHLLERVPEAELYLYQKRPRSKSITKVE